MLKECFDKYAPADMESVSGREIRKGRNKLMSMVEEQPRSRAVSRRAVVIPIAAVMLAVGTVTAGAASDWNFEKLIASFYPTTAGDSEKMADAEQKLDGMLHQTKDCVTSSTFEKYDVTMSDYIFNGKSIMYSIYVRAKDGTPFENFTEIYGYGPVEEDTTVNGRSLGGGSGWDVLEDGTLCLNYTRNLHGMEITEPTKATITFNGLELHGISDEDRARLSVPKDELFYDEASRSYYVINENGEEESVVTHYNRSNEPIYFTRMSDYFKVLDDGVFTAEITLDPVGGVVPFTLSDGKNSAYIKISSSYAEVSLSSGITAGGEDATYWSGCMHDVIFIYDTDGNVMICPDDYDDPGPAAAGGGDMDSCTVGFPKLIDVEKIGAIRIGGYTYGDVPAIDYEKYPYISDFYGIAG